MLDAVHLARDASQDDKVHLLERAKEPRGRVARGNYGIARVTHHRQL